MTVENDRNEIQSKKIQRVAECGQWDGLRCYWPGRICGEKIHLKRQNPVQRLPGTLHSGIFPAVSTRGLYTHILLTCKHHHVLEIGLDLVATSEVKKERERVDVGSSSQKHRNLAKDAG